MKKTTYPDTYYDSQFIDLEKLINIQPDIEYANNTNEQNIGKNLMPEVKLNYQTIESELNKINTTKYLRKHLNTTVELLKQLNCIDCSEEEIAIHNSKKGLSYNIIIPKLESELKYLPDAKNPWPSIIQQIRQATESKVNNYHFTLNQMPDSNNYKHN